MGSMTDEEYASIFLQLLGYVPYLMEEKAKIQIFISGLPVSFKDKNEFDDLRLLEESIRNLKHCYEKQKRKTESNNNWKGNEKKKGKWDNKRGKSQDTYVKENAIPYKKFNAFNKVHGFQFEEKNKGDENKPLQCSTCGSDHHRRDYP